jgi:hypothetical protein
MIPKYGLSKIWILLLVFNGLLNAQIIDTTSTDTSTASSGDQVTIQLNTFVESSEVPLNRKVKYHVELSWIGDLSRVRIKPVEQPILTNLLLEGSGSSNKLEPLSDGGFRAVKTITYQFKPVEMGMAYVEGIIIKYEDTVTGAQDELQAQRIMIEIIDSIAEGSGGGVKAIIYIVLLIIFFGACAYFMARYINKRKMNAEAPPQDICLAQEYLTRISQDVDPKSTNLSEMTSRLSIIFREYLSRDFHLAAREASSQEIIEQLEIKQFDETDLTTMKELFEKFDLIKFAREPVDPAEFSNIYGTIEAFLLKQIQNWQAQQELNKKEA